MNSKEESGQSEPKINKKSKLGGQTYSCDKCDCVATQGGSLTRHVNSIHMGVRYPCDKCEYAVTTTGDLKIHIGYKHGGVR